MNLKAFVTYQALRYLLNGPKIAISLSFDRFMSPECTDALVLAFTTKTGQSSGYETYLFLFFFLSKRALYLGILLAKFQNLDFLKSYSR